MGKIVFVFVIIVLVGIGLYFYNNSNMVGKGVNGFNILDLLPHLPQRTSTAPVYSFVPQPTVISPAPPAPTSGTSVAPYNIPQGFTASQLSPYFGQVRLGNVSPGYNYSYSGSYGQVSLYAYLSQSTTTVDVTGWQIKTNRGGEYIPQAVVIYDPSGLAAPSDIRLKSGDTVNLYSTSAPVNLRLNKCIGYLPNQSQFIPQLPQNCPYPDRSQIQSFSGACQNYITSLGNCQLPNFNDFRVPQNDYSCLDYLNTHFNYYSCYNAHFADPDFLSNEVRVWMGSSPFDQLHDKVLLLDRNGLLVDVYTY